MATICLINALFPPEAQGGAENYVLRTAAELSERGHDVSVITTRKFDGIGSLRPKKTVRNGFDVWRFYPANLSHLSDGTGRNLLEKALWRQIDIANPHPAFVIDRLLKRIDPDIVHTNNLLGLSTVLGRVIQRHELRHVHTLHDYGLICPKNNLLRDWTAPDDELVVCSDPPVPCRAYAKQKQAAVGTPDVVTGPSRHVIDVHNQHGFFDAIPTSRVRLGVTDVVESVPSVPKTPTVLYVGSQQRSKGLDTLFDAAERLSEIEFVVCGSGPYAEETERRASTIPNVRYLGYVADQQLAELRRTASVAVVPSIWMENSPFVIYESFAAGLPVVGSRIGGIPELITEGETGLLFEPGNSTELVERISAAVGDRNRLEEMRMRAVNWADHHTIGDHVSTLVSDIYHLSS